MDEHGTGELPEQPGQVPTPYGAPPSFGTSPAYGAVAAYGATPAYGSAPTPEVLDSTAPTWSVLPGSYGTGAGPTGPSRGRRTGVVAAVVVGALLVSGGAYAAWSHLNGSGSQPADVLPASTVAVAEVDLDPSAAQKLALFNLLRKFPDASGLDSTDRSFGDWLARKLAGSGSSADSLDFARDVQPWLGKRFAVAAVPAPAGSGAGGSAVDGVLVVQETDDKAASAAMDKLRAHGSPDLGYALLDGYLVVTPDSAKGASRVVADAQKASLSTATHFSSDVDSLGSDQVVTAWVDATRAGQLLKDQLGSLGGDAGALGAASPFGGGLGGPFDELKGRWVLGVHATNDSVEMRMRSYGGTVRPAAPPVKLEHVVPDPIAVVAVSGYGKDLAQSWATVSSSPMYQPLLEEAKQVGLDLPADLEKLLGDQLTASIGGKDFSQAPWWLATATSQHPAAGKAVLDKLFALAGPDARASLGVTARADGNTLYVGSSDAIVSGATSTADAEALTGSELFQAAVADPGNAQELFYVDLSKVWDVVTKTGDKPPAEVQHLKAVGLTVTLDGADSDSTLRLIIR